MTESIFWDELYKQFAWFDSLFTPVVENCSKEFFFDGLEFKLVAASTNMNILSQNDTFFVTKVKINSKNDVFIRISQDAINVILDKVLGKNNRKFDLTEVSELEAKIITAFNDFIFESLTPNFNVDPHRRYTEILHLTYYVKSESSENAAKFIISVPKDVLSPVSLETTKPHFTDDDFIKCMVNASFLVGTTSFPMADVKRLEPGDVVVLEKSNSSRMTLISDGLNQRFQIRPNPKIVEPYENAIGSGMEESMSNSNLWDSIQVDLSAEFEKVKVPLGDLKNIEEGLVVDLCSVYDNKIFLKVGEKVVATGGLVIINDRFGVRIENIPDQGVTAANNVDNNENGNAKGGQAADDFDYSDFEVEENKG